MSGARTFVAANKLNCVFALDTGIACLRWTRGIARFVCARHQYAMKRARVPRHGWMH